MKRIATVSVFFLVLILCAFVALPPAASMQRAQGQGGRGAGGRGGRGAPAPPQNLQVLPADTDVRMVMQGVAAALGVECTFCHVQGDFAADDMPTKLAARQMMRMVQAINTNYLADLPTHEAGEEVAAVSCNTCHRGSMHPDGD